MVLIDIKNRAGKERMTVENERAIVVFPSGVRINRAWTLQKWLPAFSQVPHS